MFLHFNFWYLVGPVCVLAAIIYGWKSATGKREERSLYIKIGDGIIGLVSAFAIAALLFLESFDGTIAFFGATAEMAQEDPEYILSASVAILFAAIVFGVVLEYASAVVRLLRSRYLQYRKRLRFNPNPPKNHRRNILLEKIRNLVHKRQKSRQERKRKRFLLQEDLDRAAKIARTLRPGDIAVIKVELYSEREVERMRWRRPGRKSKNA